MSQKQQQQQQQAQLNYQRRRSGSMNDALKPTKTQQHKQQSNDVSSLCGIDVGRLEKLLGNDQPDSYLLKSCRLNDASKSNAFHSHLCSVKSKNERYLKHVSGDCKCGKCQCTRCKCVVGSQLQLDSKKNPKSVYQQEYAKRQMPLRASPFVLDKDPYRQKETNTGKEKFTTTHRADFYTKKAVNPKVECGGTLDRNTLMCGVQAISANTVYASSFRTNVIPKNVLFTHSEVEYLRVPHERIALNAATESRMSFRGEEKPKNTIEQINFALDRQKNLKIPIKMGDVIVERQSTSRQSYAVPIESNSRGAQQQSPQQSYDTLEPQVGGGNGKLNQNQQQLQQHQQQSLSSAKKKRSSSAFGSASIDYDREFIKTRNSWVSVFSASKAIPNHEGQFVTSKGLADSLAENQKNCPGWHESGDPIDRIPKKFYSTFSSSMVAQL